MTCIDPARKRALSAPRLSIVAKLTLLVFAVGLPLSALLAWSVHALFRSERAAAEQQVQGITNAMATRLEDTVEHTRSMLKEIAHRPHVQAMDRSRCDPFVDELRTFMPQYANINTFNLEWEFVCSASLTAAHGVVRSAYPQLYERMRAADDMVMSGPVRGQLTGRLIVIAAYPVKDAGGALVGAVTAPIDLSVLSAAVAGEALPEYTHTRVIDGEGIVVTSFPGSEQIGKPAEGAAAGALTREPGTWIAPGPDGEERVFANSPVRRTGWIAFAGVPAAASFAQFERQRIRTVVALFLVLAIAALLVFAIARRISRPLRELQRDAGILAAGRLAHRSQIVTRDEVGQLAASFNDMAQALESNESRSSESAARILRLNRVYAVLSGINGAIVRIRERGELFREACRIAVSEGGFKVARVIELDSHGWASMAASSEPDSSLFQRVLDQHNGDTAHSPTVISLVLRSGEPVIANDVANDSRFPNRAALTAGGNFALALLPIFVGKRIAGAFLLRTQEPGMFDAEELRLLSELVANLSFALESIDRRSQLEYLEYYDSLTGLANRRLFLERVEQHMRSAATGGHKLVVYLIDLERFRNINDTLGRPAGDELLKQVAQWLSRHDGDAHLLARVGPDLFATVVPKRIADGAGALRLEKSIEEFMLHPFRLDDTDFRIAVKVGGAVYPDDGGSADVLFRNAEAALKKAKASGARYLFYTAAMNETVADKLSLENQLRLALENGQFVLHYQPKVNLASGKITGAEALIRWNDPRTGLVPPGRFIPILEETGLIYDVGRWALRRAIEDYLRWRAAGLPAVRIAVNVSPLQLRNHGFVEEIRQAIGVQADAAGGLELEITESLIMEDVKHNIGSLQAIRAMGVTIAIDDFGTGFSSLAYLAKLPVDTLKIDRSFVLDMTVAPEGLSLVSTIISLAHSLKLKVVAEGVETEEQSRLLHLLNCDEMQGYLFSKPVPAAEFEARFLAPAPALAAVA